jgi:small subunit ribosomal protein S6
MKLPSSRNTYRSMVIVGPDCSDNDLKTIAANYAKELKALGATTISMVSRGQRDLAYMIKKLSFGYYIEMCFESSPQVLEPYETKLKLDKNVIRYLVLNVDNE